MDPTQVDARYQIQFLPPGGGTIIDDFPVSTGPYTVPILLINNDGGLRVDDFHALNTIRASLTQQGVIGTLGGQQLQGEFFLVGPGGGGPTPLWLPDVWALTLQNGGIAFFNDPEGAVTTPTAQIQWTGGGGSPELLISSGGAVSLLSSAIYGGDLNIENQQSGALLQLGGVGGTFLDDPNLVTIDSGGSQTTFGSYSTGTGVTLDFAGGHPGADAYSLQDGTYIGQYGTDSIGNEFSGGLCTLVGSGSTGITIGNPVGGSTANEVLYVDGGGNLAQDSGFTYTPGVLGVNEVLGDTGGLTLDAANNVVTIPNVLNLGLFLYIYDRTGSGKGKFKMAPFVPVALLASDTPLGWTAGDNIGGGFSPDTALTRDAAGDVGFSDGAGNIYATLGNSGLVMTGVGANGSVQVLGTSGNSFAWGSDNLPPASTQAVSAPALAYGQGTILEYLGSPDAWARISIGGTDYLLPAYLP